MNNEILKQVIREISNSEVSILKQRLIEEKELSTQQKSNMINQIIGFTQTETYCNNFVNNLTPESFESFISTVGIANVCRFFGNLCSQYHMMQPENLGKGKPINSFSLELNGEKTEVPITTRAGDPVDYINGNIGISNKSTDLSENDYYTIQTKFGEAANIISECIDKKSDYELPVYENMNASQVRSSLHLLVDRGIDLINIIGDNKSISQGSPKTR